MISARFLTEILNEYKMNPFKHLEYSDIDVMTLVEFVEDNLLVVRELFDKTFYKQLSVLLYNVEYKDFHSYNDDSIQMMFFELMVSIVNEIETYFGEDLKKDLRNETRTNLLEAYIMLDHSALEEDEIHYYLNEMNYNFDDSEAKQIYKLFVEKYEELNAIPF